MTRTSSVHRLVGRTPPILGIAGLVALAGVAPAAAGRATVEHVEFSEAQVFAAGEWEVCPDLTFDLARSWEETGVILTQSRGADGLWHWSGRFQGVETFTNPETGHSFTRSYAINDRDHEVTDNGDGTLTITIRAAGPNHYALDGERLFTDTGVVQYRVLVDHAGTPSDPEDDTFLEFIGLDKVTGLRETDGRDFCADLQDLLG